MPLVSKVLRQNLDGMCLCCGSFITSKPHAPESPVLAAGVCEVAQVAFFGAGVEEQQCGARDREVGDDVGVAAPGFVLEQRAVAAVVVARLDPPMAADVGRPLADGARAGVQRAEVPDGFAGGLAGR